MATSCSSSYVPTHTYAVCWVDLCISLPLLWMLSVQHLSLCVGCQSVLRLWRRGWSLLVSRSQTAFLVKAVWLRETRSLHLLVGAVPLIDISIYLYCWQQWCIYINGTWLYYRITFVCLYYIGMMVHCMPCARKPHTIRSNRSQGHHTNSWPMHCMYTGTCIHVYMIGSIVGV